MPLAHSRFGPYEVVGHLGSGGMGEVYRGRDTRLNRDVAIKVLPASLASDPDRLTRLTREAQILASINHLNIAAIYGLEDAGTQCALILELVEGSTLEQRIADKALTRDDTLAIVRQLIEALDAAHQRGIIHRDLKPANIKLRPDGTLKVLDFGLAKTIEPVELSADVSAAPTMVTANTEPGLILGTPAYMSPEQARGAAVDKRTDIWAFGCILFELLTLRKAFSGATATDVLAGIIEREPDWSLLPDDTPPAVMRLLRRCLEKDVRRRLRDIGDAGTEIDAAAASAPLRAHRRPRHVLIWSTLAVILAAAIGVGGGRWSARAGAPSPAVPDNPLADAKFSLLTDFPGTETSAAISPDGRFVAFLSDRDGEFDLWLTQVGTGRFTNLTPDIPSLTPNFVVATVGFSADGAEIWFTRETRKVRIPLTGGTPRTFLGERANGPAWSIDGSRIAYSNAVDGDPTFVADGTGANARQIFVDDTGVHNHNHVWSADSQWIYFVHGRDVSEQMDIWRVRPSGEERQQLTEHPAAINFVAPLDARTLLYVAPAEDRSGPWLWALDVERKLSRRVNTGVEQYVSVAASSDGRRVAATRANPEANLWSVPLLNRLADDSDLKPFPMPTVRALAPRFSGTSVFYLSARGTGDGLWRVQDGQASEIWNGADGALSEPPAVSPDGRRVAIILRKGAQRHVAIMSADGSDLRFVAETINVLGSADWAPDAASLVVGGRDTQGLGLFKIPADGGPPVRLVAGAATNPVWSPDGTLIVYAGPNVGGQQTLHGIQPDGTAVPLTQMNVTVLTQQGHRFLPSGKGIVYIQRSFYSPFVDFQLLDLATKTTRHLARLANQGEIRTFDITEDEKQIVFDRSRQNSDIVLIDLPK